MVTEKVKIKKGKRVKVSKPMVLAISTEVANTLMKRLPGLIRMPKRAKSKKKETKIENPIFLDTSAIIDGRIFEVISLGLLTGTIVILENILLELKHVADSQDAVKRERGRNGLDYLEKVKKVKGIKFETLAYDEKKYPKDKFKEVDELLIKVAKDNKGKVITGDYNLTKKASIQGVKAININELANVLKIRAVPGEALHVSVLHKGKDPTQGVGYLDDGTMIVIENASDQIGKTVDVVVIRVIQTSAGRILFAKKI